MRLLDVYTAELQLVCNMALHRKITKKQQQKQENIKIIHFVLQLYLRFFWLMCCCGDTIIMQYNIHINSNCD